MTKSVSLFILKLRAFIYCDHAALDCTENQEHAD